MLNCAGTVGIVLKYNKKKLFLVNVYPIQIEFMTRVKVWNTFI